MVAPISGVPPRSRRAAGKDSPGGAGRLPLAGESRRPSIGHGAGDTPCQILPGVNRMVQPLLQGATYRRGVYLLLGAVLLLPYLLLGAAFIQELRDAHRPPWITLTL